MAYFIKVITTVLVIGSLAYGSYLLLQKTDITVPSFLRPVSGPRLVISMDGFRFTRSENGRVSWRMKARSADLYENKLAHLQDIDILYMSPENGDVTLLGETGTLDTSNGDSSIRRVTREVSVVTSDGYLLTTDSLFWKAGGRVVRTEDPFKLLGKEIYLEGTGMAANVDLRTIKVNNNVKAVLQD